MQGMAFKLEFTVRTKPGSARVRILNINPVYYSGMELDAGRYHVEVTASGYIRQKRWIQLAAGEEFRHARGSNRASRKFATIWIEVCAYLPITTSGMTSMRRFKLY